MVNIDQDCFQYSHQENQIQFVDRFVSRPLNFFWLKDSIDYFWVKVVKDGRPQFNNKP